MNARASAWLAVLLALLAGLASFLLARVGADRIERALTAPQGRSATLPAVVVITPGASAATVAREFESRGLLEDARHWRAWMRASGQAGRLQVGEYLVEKPLSMVELGELLTSGRVILHAVTIPEGLDRDETAARLAASGLWTEEALRAAFSDPSAVRDFDPEAADLEGYLFPDTYRVPRTETAAGMARTMVARYRVAWKDSLAATGMALGPRTPREIATLASLVEKETAVADERTLVASVYANRLRIGMRLECDPTTIHALKRDGLWTGGPLLIRDLTHPSPWNTYVASGLPPGPIASFGEGALRAALAPADSDYLFFVATGDGGHRFAATHSEHERNVAAYRKRQKMARASTDLPAAR